MRTFTPSLSIRQLGLATTLGVFTLLFAGAAQAQEETATEGAAPADVVAPYQTDDWKEAGPDDQNGIRFRSCTITIGADRILTGTIFRIDETSRLQTPVKDIELRLVQDGKALEIATPSEENGEFQFGPVEPGIFSLIGQGTDGFVAYSFHVEASPEINDAEKAPTEPPAAEGTPDDGAAEQQAAAPKLRMISSCAMNPTDMPMAIELIQAFLGVESGEQGEEPVLDEKMEESLDGEDSPKDNESVNEDEPITPPAPQSRRSGNFKVHHEQDEVRTTALSWHAVPLQEDGSLIGRVRMLVAADDEADDEEGTLETRPPKDMRVFLIQEGRVIAKAPCSPRGIFIIPDLPAGLYSFVSVGLDGFAAMTVDVLPAVKKPEEDEQTGGIRSASLRRIGFIQNTNTLPNFDTAAVPPGDSNQLQTKPVITTNTQQDMGDLGMPLGLNSNSNVGGTQPGSSSSFAPITGGPSGVGTPGGGGFGGGVPGGGGGGGDAGVPEIDPASSGVALSVMMALLCLLIDLRRPRESTSN